MRHASDGTLVTQRFHFSQVPHPYRHVLGWYRLIRELNNAGVSAICVFDGKERSLAKGLEVERRKEVRRLAIARGLLENDRLKRLRSLSDVLHRFRNLDVVAREQAAELLRQLHLDKDISSFSVPSPSTPLPRTRDQAESLTSHLLDASSGITSDDEREALFSLAEEDLLSSPLTTASNTEREFAFGLPPLDEFSSVDDSTVRDISGVEDASLDVTALMQAFEDNLLLSSDQELPEETENISANDVTPVTDESVFLEAEKTSPSPKAQSILDSLGGPPIDSTTGKQEHEDINATFASLYLDFRQSISKLALLATRDTSTLSPFVSSVPSDPDTQAEVVMTKAQYQLTLDERNLWEQLVSSPSIISNSSEDEFSSAVEMTLANLTNTSNVMSESYQRRTSPPTAQTYEESKTIIQAMGVPCIDSIGPFEAEALASSIVLSGLADYVASEDTDVLVYDAPLIRNLTNRQSPLIVVSGVDVRMVLELDRASFIDFALLLGTDFSQRIKNVGPARALRFIKTHGSIERIVELETKYAPQVPHNVYLAQVEAARMVYQTLPPVPEKNLLEQRSVDEAEVVRSMEQYRLGRALMNSDWDYGAALDGNYFHDNPSAF